MSRTMVGSRASLPGPVSTTAKPRQQLGRGASLGPQSDLPDGSAVSPVSVPVPLAAVGALACAKLAVHLLTNGQYGYHRDELYYLASGRHPAFGYVDYPAITPLLARLDALLLGGSPWALRLLPSLVGAGLVVLVTLIARELGGGRKAQLLAALSTATSLLLLGSNWLFQTVTFDQLWWILALYLFARLIRTGDGRLWLAIGGVLGLGLETKLTIVGLGAGLAIAIVVTPLRTQLRTRWPWLGLLVAGGLLAPNLVWQQLTGWPTLEFLRTHNAVIASSGERTLALNFDSGGIFAFLAFQPVLIGVLSLPLWLMGWSFLLRQRRYRALGVAALSAFLLFLPVGKAYYPGPLIPVLLAAGCVQLEAIATIRRWRRATAVAASAMVLQALLQLPMGIPLVPESSLARFGLDEFRKDFADTAGWPELVARVADAYQQLGPAERQATVILAGNYGEAGALDRYGPAYGLPAVLSPHLTYWYWKPAHVEARTVLAVGLDEAEMHRLFAEVSLVGRVQAVSGVRNEEVGRAILLCRGPIVPLDDAWPQLRNFT